MTNTITLYPREYVDAPGEGEPQYYRIVDERLFTSLQLDDQIADPDANLVAVWNVNKDKVIVMRYDRYFMADIISWNGRTPFYYYQHVQRPMINPYIVTGVS
jgi:hypothetical protein